MTSVGRGIRLKVLCVREREREKERKREREKERERARARERENECLDKITVCLSYSESVYGSKSIGHDNRVPTEL